VIEVQTFELRTGWAPRFCARCQSDLLAQRRALEFEAQEAEAAERRQPTDAEEEARRLGALDVPDRYIHATLANFETHGSGADMSVQAKAKRAAYRWLDLYPTRRVHGTEFPHVVLFRGKPGTGKDHVAWALAKIVAVHEGGSVLVREWAKIMRDVNRAFRRDERGRSEGEGEDERIARYLLPDLLIVRELSRHAFYGQATQRLMDIVGEREQWYKATIITTNAEAGQLGEVLGEAMQDRMTMIEFGERSYRKHHRPSGGTDHG
jgi:DNA replication protein DnaC